MLPEALDGIHVERPRARSAARSSRGVLLAAAVAAAALVLSGCCCPRLWGHAAASAQPPAPFYVLPRAAPPAPTAPSDAGFLADYQRLRPHPRYPGGWLWLAPDLDLRAYDHLLIDPVVVHLGKGEVVADEVKAEAARIFREILVETLDPYYAVVDEPGPHVLRVRLALTDLVPADDSAGDAGPVHVAGAELEAEALDSTSGRVLAAAISRVEGSTRGETVPERWRPVEGAFREWADRLLEFVDSHRP